MVCHHFHEAAGAMIDLKRLAGSRWRLLTTERARWILELLPGAKLVQEPNGTWTIVVPLNELDRAISVLQNPPASVQIAFMPQVLGGL